MATGERFRESNEARAIQRFRAWEARNDPQTFFCIPPAVPEKHQCDEAFFCQIAQANTDVIMTGNSTLVETKSLWGWLRRLLQEDPEWVAKQIGIPALAALRDLPGPRPSVWISEVIAAYERFSTATPKSRREALKPFERLVKFAAATRLSDLTDAKLIAFRKTLLSDPKLKSSGTLRSYFSRIRNVLRLAGRGDLDAVELEAMAARCRAKLFAPTNNVEDDPHPITAEDFRRLLAATEQTQVPQMWRAMLLLALNGAMYLEELCDLRWSGLDLGKGTLVSRRRKRGRCLRVAVLWPETIAAIQALPCRGKSEFVFISRHGTRFNRNTKINDFADLRRRAGIDGVTFSHIRDGAYTAACNAPGVEEKYARLLAGHKAQGLQDKYVLRNPKIVKPACDAVYCEYAPFPPPTNAAQIPRGKPKSRGEPLQPVTSG